MIYSVSSELYLEVAARLAEAVGGGSYFSGSLTFPFGDTECRLTASVIVYRRRERLPEGDRDVIARPWCPCGGSSTPRATGRARS